MANSFLNDTQYLANAMLLQVKNNLVMGNLVDSSLRDDINDYNGLTIYEKRPPRFVVVESTNGDASLSTQNIVAGSDSIAVNNYSKVHCSIGDLEYVTSFNDLMENQTMKAKALALANKIDTNLCAEFNKFRMFGTTADSTSGADADINTFAKFQLGYTRLFDSAVPLDSLSCVMTGDDAAALRSTFTAGTSGPVAGDFQRSVLERARIPLMSEVDSYASQNIQTLTTGVRATSQVTGDVDDATFCVDYTTVKDRPYMYQVFNMDQFTAGDVIKVGETFTIADVYAVNPVSGATLPYLQVFTVLGGLGNGSTATAANIGSDITIAAGPQDASVIITPPIIVPNKLEGGGTPVTDAEIARGRTNAAFATCSAVPVTNATITFRGDTDGTAKTFRQRAMFHKSAIRLVWGKLRMPDTGKASYATDPKTGITIRVWKGSDISTGAHVIRWDAIYGYKVMDPLLGVRLTG